MIKVTENIIQISQENDAINISVVEQPIEIVANNVVYRESPTDKTPYWGYIEGDLADQTDLVLEFEKKANISHEHATSDVTGLDAKLTSYDTHVADSVAHVTQTNKDYWGSKAAGDHNHNTVYEPKNSNIQTHIGTSTNHVSVADRLSWDGKAAFIHYHSYNDLTDKPNLTLKANQTALDTTNSNVTALQAVSHSHSNSAALATVTNTGDGTKFHANDGTYKTITSGGSWGSITGTLSAQTDLATALNSKALQSDLTTTNGNVSSLSTAVSNISTDLDTAEADILALQTDKANSSDVYLKTETYTQTEINTALSAKEPSLGNPTTNGMVLSSTVGGTRSWIEVSSGGLTNFTEARTITAPNATIPVHSIKATGAETNIDFAIVPKGTGAIVARVPDNAIIGGNKRGNYAVDLQLYRMLNTQVASGAASGVLSGEQNKATNTDAVVCGGYGNTASGQYSFVAGGATGTASGKYSTVGGGYFNNASGIKSVICGGNNGTTAGLSSAILISTSSCQAYGEKSAIIIGGSESQTTGKQSIVMNGDSTYSYLYGQIAQGGAGKYKSRQASNLTGSTYTTAASTAELYLDDSSSRAVLRNNCAWAFDITILAHSSTNALHTARFKRSGLILRGTTAATTTLEGAVQTIGTDIINSNLTGCDVAISADTTNGSLKVEVTGIAATTIVWQAKIELVEIEI